MGRFSRKPFKSWLPKASSNVENDQPSQAERSIEHSAPLSSFPDGVKVLHECPDATVDICFIHGLTGNRETTWTAHGQSAPWPTTLLSTEHKLTGVRIISYGYDAYVVRASVAGSNRLIDHATNLLNDLATDRACDNASSRTLIFIAHSLGGLVCKKAILLSRNHPEAHLRSIFNCTKGIIFMGTPHKGSWMADWATISAGALGFVKSTNKSLLDILQTDNQLLEAIQVEFWSMIREQRESGRSFEITCFFEELPLPVVGKVVSKESATLEGYTSISIHADHGNMVKFSSRDDNGYKRLLGELIRWKQDTSSMYQLDDRDRQCLNDVWASDPKIEKTRIQDTKGGLLKDVYVWILENPDFKKWRDSQQHPLLWIRGDPGKGKTMLLCGIIDELKSSIDSGKPALLSFFFCQATDPRTNNATAVLRGLIRQLVDQQPLLVKHIRQKYDTYRDIFSWNDLSEIFTNILEDAVPKNAFLVVDGLDECQDGLIKLISMIRQKWSSYSDIKWVVSSRNWPSIQDHLNDTEQLSLELNSSSVAAAVELYITTHKMQRLVELKRYNSDTENTVQRYLSENSKGTFLWVALVCQYLEKVHLKPHERMKCFPPGLDSLYKRMLQNISESCERDICQAILDFMTIASRPVTLRELSCFVEDDVSSTAIDLCGSFLTVREGTVSFVHQSAKDFLLESKKAIPSILGQVHHTIFSKSLQAITRTLRRDIYGLAAPGYPISLVKPPDPDLLAAVQYACVYWVDHLIKCFTCEWGCEDLHDSGSVDRFFRKDYLHWLEALSLFRSLPEGIASIRKLNDWLKTIAKNSQLIDRVQDAYRFILYHGAAIRDQPLQIYNSALVFSPSRSITRNQYMSQEPDWVVVNSELEETWSACLQTLEGHTGDVKSVAFSYDNRLLASASDDYTIKIWDVSSGECLQSLKVHDYPDISVIFSHDSKLLVFILNHRTIKIWHVSSWQCLRTLEGHTESVKSVAFTLDDKILASASDDYTIKIWNVSSGECLRTLYHHYYDQISPYVFSHDSKLFASVSDNKTVKIWDVSSWQCLQTFEQTFEINSAWITSIVFSRDSTLLASASNTEDIKIWDISSGECLQTFEEISIWFTSLVFSHDSRLLASTSNFQNVKVWDVSSGECLQIIEGQHIATSTDFSRDSRLFASASGETISLWDARTWQCPQTLKSEKEYIYSAVFSHDLKRLASLSDYPNFKIWDVNSGQCLHVLEGPDSEVESAFFSHDSTQLVSTWSSGHIMLWDVNVGQCLWTLELGGEILSDSLCPAVFSHNSRWIAYGSPNRTIEIVDASNGQCLQTRQSHNDYISLLVFSHDSKMLASVSDDDHIKIWDASSWQSLQTLEPHDSWVKSVVFSRDSNLLASLLGDDTTEIWNTSSGQCLRIFKSVYTTSIKFDVTDSFLETDRGIIKLSLNSDTTLPQRNSEAPQFHGYGVSADLSWITWNSENVLWLPPEYRPRCPTSIAVAQSCICIGSASGRLLVLKLDPQKMLRLFAKNRPLSLHELSAI